jgi:hypothetical protein
MLGTNFIKGSTVLPAEAAESLQQVLPYLDGNFPWHTYPLQEGK